MWTHENKTRWVGPDQLLGKLWADVRGHICASAKERNALFTQKLVTQWELKLFSRGTVSWSRGDAAVSGRRCWPCGCERGSMLLARGVSQQVLSIASENITGWSDMETEAKVCRTANADWVNEHKRRRKCKNKMIKKNLSLMRTHTHKHWDKLWYCILTSGAEQGHIRNMEPPAERNKRGWTQISSLFSLNSLIRSSRCVCLCVCVCSRCRSGDSCDSSHSVTHQI